MSKQIHEQAVEKVNGLLAKLGIEDKEAQLGDFVDNPEIKGDWANIPRLADVVIELFGKAGCPGAYYGRGSVVIPKGEIKNFNEEKFEQYATEQTQHYKKRIGNIGLVNEILAAFKEASNQRYQVLLEAMCGHGPEVHMGLLLREYFKFLEEKVQDKTWEKDELRGLVGHHYEGPLRTVKYALEQMPREKQMEFVIGLASALGLTGTASILSAAASREPDTVRSGR